MGFEDRTLHWEPVENGSTLGQQGSELGIIMLDEEYDKSVRITLESNTRAAPFARTCGIYSWLLHTRFFHDELTARKELKEMKSELVRIYSLIPGEEAATKERLGEVAQNLQAFIRQYP